MKRILFAFLVTLPIAAYADHVDVIEVQLNEGCSIATYLAIKDDFNQQWAKKYDYRAEVLVPIQSHNLTSLYWVGRSASTAAFGKAWDQWNSDLKSPDSVASKLWARFSDCGQNIGRRGYDVY